MSICIRVVEAPTPTAVFASLAGPGRLCRLFDAFFFEQTGTKKKASNGYCDRDGYAILVFARLFQKAARVRGEEPRVPAFLFCEAFFFGPSASKEKSVYQIMRSTFVYPPFLLKPQAQKKRLGEKKTPLLRALPEPATFFEKKVDQKTNFALRAAF